MISIERARAIDRTAIESLLAANGLPIEGFDSAVAGAVVARDQDGVGEIVGCAAIEAYGFAGLLRSVCVAPEFRGTGLGRRLVAEAEAIAAGSGVSELYLLTETATDWFPRLGYSPATRADVPAALAASPEFTGACPDTAAVLNKTIRPLP